MRRFFLSSISLILLALLIFTVSLSAKNNVELPKMTSIQELHAVALEKNVVVQEKIKTNNLGDHYAGVFIDDNGTLNVNLTSNINKAKTAINQDGVQYNQVKHSYKKLKETMSSLEDLMLELDIVKLSLNVRSNKVIITIRDLNNEKINKINQYINPDAVEYENAVGEMQVTAAEIINGTSLDQGLTIGVGAVDSNGNDGFVTAGHALFSNGTKGTQDGDTIGTQRDSQFGGNVDAAFFEAKKGFWPWQTDYYGSMRLANGFYISSVLTNSADYNAIEGLTVTAFGGVSGEQDGVILNSDTSFTVNVNGTNYTITNAVESDYRAIPGDSGAPVLWWADNHNYAAGGLQSASLLDINGNWMPGVSRSYFVRTDNIFNTLNLSPIW